MSPGTTTAHMTRPLSRLQLLALRAAGGGKLRIVSDRLAVAEGAGRITMASVRACQRRGLLDRRNPVTGLFPVTGAGWDVLAEGCIKCGGAIEPDNTCVADGEARICFPCSGAVV